MKQFKGILLVLLSMNGAILWGQTTGIDANTPIYVGANETKSQEVNKRFFVGSSFFMLGNLMEDSPKYYRIDFGYRITSKDAIIIQPLTWAYHAPLGIPFGDSWELEQEDYPGSIQSFGIGVGYNRTLWKGLFTGVYVTPFKINYLDLNENVIQSGFQLFLQFQLDYHVEFFNNRFYIEPGITCNYWPITTNMPQSFTEVEDKWPNYFLFEPVLNFGFNF